jgi:hypothetical protein
VELHSRHGRYFPEVVAALAALALPRGGWSGRPVSAEPLEVVALLLGAYDDDAALHHVGVASSFSKRMRAELARELAPLVAGLPATRGSTAPARRRADGPAQGRGRALGARHGDGLGADRARARGRGSATRRSTATGCETRRGSSAGAPAAIVGRAGSSSSTSTRPVERVL